MKRLKKFGFIIIVLLLISNIINSNIIKGQYSVLNIETPNRSEHLYSSSSSLTRMLTAEDMEYIANRPIIKAATIAGAAPLSFINDKGEITGIFQSVLNKIADMTGLVFECSVYLNPEELLASNPDIIYGISSNYATEDMALSDPFLVTQTVIFLNSSVNSNQLEEHIYAAVNGSILPEDVNERKVIYYNTREESLNAVEKGEADYGYGNAFSVSYYTMLNNYKKIVTVPVGNEIREYCIGVLGQDEILLSIINKSVNLLDKNQMYDLILDIASNIERKVTLSMIMDYYGVEIVLFIIIIIIIMLSIVLKNVLISNELREQNRKYEELSQILLIKAQLDELTGLYNAGTAKSMITDRLHNKKKNELDAMILMDCDGFKTINDTQGHLTGNHVLERIATFLKRTFRNNDIIGRMGGDEFCVYMKNVSSENIAIEKCKQLNNRIKKIMCDENVSVSAGIYLVNDKDTYEEAFKRADEALYQAKHKGKSLVVIWNAQD